MQFEKWTNRNKDYYKIGDKMVLCGLVLYRYDKDNWQYAPDVYEEFVANSAEADKITEAEAKAIVEKNGGTKFDANGYLLVTDEEGHLSGIADN